MGYILTNSDKWKDLWFGGLSPHAKLLFIFLCENCDSAGFFEINYRYMLFALNLKNDDLKKAITELSKSYIKSNDKKYIWLNNFLKHQKKLPLNSSNNSHKQIIQLLTENLNDSNMYSDCKEMKAILPNETIEVKTVEKEENTPIKVEEPIITEKEKNKKPTTPRKRFVEPKVEEIVEYMIKRGLQPKVAKFEGEQFLNHYESVGWVVGKVKMVKWKGAVSGWVNRWYEKNKIKQPLKSKLENIKEAKAEFGEVDWNEVYTTQN